MRLLWISVTSVVISLAAVGCGGLPEDTGAPVDSVDQDVTAAAATGASAGAGAGAGTTKVTICHIPPGNPSNAHTITVGQPAVRAHLAHGDTVGACGSGGGGGGGGGGECGGIGTACTQSSSCCAGLSCVTDSLLICTGAGPCSCQVLIN